MRVAHAVVGVLALAGCGSGANKRILTRPDSYHKLVAFPSTGNPVDIRSLEREYPELKGVVITAPEWLDQFERMSNARAAMGLGLFEYRIGPGASLSIEVEEE